MPKLANIDWANNEVAYQMSWTIYYRNDLISIDAKRKYTQEIPLRIFLIQLYL